MQSLKKIVANGLMILGCLFGLTVSALAELSEQGKNVISNMKTLAD